MDFEGWGVAGRKLHRFDDSNRAYPFAAKLQNYTEKAPMTPKRHDQHKAGKNILLSRYRQGKAAREIAVRECSLEVNVVFSQKRRRVDAAQGDLFTKQRNPKGNRHV